MTTKRTDITDPDLEVTDLADWEPEDEPSDPPGLTPDEFFRATMLPSDRMVLPTILPGSVIMSPQGAEPEDDPAVNPPQEPL